jgi:predicted metal-dependent peptidase
MRAFEGEDSVREALKRSGQALRLASASLPHLSGLARVVRLKASRRVSVAAVTASGLVVVNPDLFADLPMGDAAFILAHELLHLALDTHGRQSGSNFDPLLFNFAHDYIINDILSGELGRSPPLGGLERPGSRHESLEQLVLDLYNEMDYGSEGPGATRCWGSEDHPARTTGGRSRSPAPSPMSRALRDAGLIPPEPEPETEPETGPELPADDPLAHGDVIPPEREPEFDPDLTDEQRRSRREQIRREAAKAASLGALGGQLDALARPADCSEPDRGEGVMRAIRDAYHTPWELALQHWMDAVAPGPRSFARPSRRGADRSDCVLPGRKREGWALHVVLDTSGSMADVLPRALGALASFCEGAGVAEVRVLQCDEEVTRDEWVTPEELAEYRVAGFGGSDMTPGLTRLADEPEVAAALVLTDGYISYPADEPPFHVLWVLLGDISSSFEPPYGETIRMKVPPVI